MAKWRKKRPCLYCGKPTRRRMEFTSDIGAQTEQWPACKWCNCNMLMSIAGTGGRAKVEA